MRKVGLLLTTFTTKEIVKKYITDPLIGIFTSDIIVDEEILRAINSGQKERLSNLLIHDIREFKNRGIYDIIFTCSSITNLKWLAAKEGVRIFAIDDFIKKETNQFNKVAFLATAQSALENYLNIFSRNQLVAPYFIREAFQFLLGGDIKNHNKYIVGNIKTLPKDIECIVLAQISMIHAIDDILLVADNKPIFSGATTLVKNLIFQKYPVGISFYDSISYINDSDENKFIISGSHGGMPSVKYAVENNVFGAVFNNAGIGKNSAGISGLPYLDENNILGIAVDATSAEIGNAKDTYENGEISNYNNLASEYGAQKGMRLKDFIDNLFR